MMTAPTTRVAFRSVMPLIAHPFTGKEICRSDVVDEVSTFPTNILDVGKGCLDFRMVIFPVPSNRNAADNNKSNNQVLLEIPNSLGWKYHYGSTASTEELLLQEVQQQVLSGLDVPIQLVPAGLMLFTFATTDDAPMRVRVYRCCGLSKTSLVQNIGTVDSSSTRSSHPTPLSCQGKLYDETTVPYSDMWADDIHWMPTLLRQPTSYFEGHFVFDGGPAKSSTLLRHRYELTA